MVDNVMIDAVRYDVEVVDGPLVGNGQDCAGVTDFNEAKIQLRTEAAASGGVARLLMHEVIHALMYERGLKDDTYNEQVVDAVAAGVVNLIRQNPDLVRLVVEG